MKKSVITGHKDRRLPTMEIAENFFEILLLWTIYLATDLLRSQAHAS